jgi:hypothetical protein
MASRPSTSGLALVSAAALALEICLSRIFAVQQFHHFAFVVVSLAVLGSAAGGILLAARPKIPPLPLLTTVFALSALVAYLIIDFLPFDSYSMAWDPKQVGILLLYFLAAGAPFVIAGWIIGACLVAGGAATHRPYAANLVGSSLGCLGALLALDALPPQAVVLLVVAAGLFAAACFHAHHLPRLGLLVLASLTLLLSLRSPLLLDLHLSPYKPLASARLVNGARQTMTRWSASARLDVVESQSIHVFPGLSLNAPAQQPLQAALFLDGDGPLPITALSPDDPLAADLAAHMPATLAYRLRPSGRALLVQPGTGLDALLALAAGAQSVTLPTDEPLVLETLRGPYASFSRGLLRDPRLAIVNLASRSALLASPEHFDIVQFCLTDSYRPVTSGAFSLTEDYILTTEAFSDAYLRLSDSGLLVITRWLQTPPSESARAFATLLAALDDLDVPDPASHLIAYRSMRTATLIASRRPFTAEELSTTRSFLQANAFDPIVLPDLLPEELNRFNRLPSDDYYLLYASLLADRQGTIEAYDFNLRPPTDDRPYFFHFFRWRQTPGLLAQLGQTWQPFGGSGYFVLLALLALMLFLAAPLIVVPWVLLRRERDHLRAIGVELPGASPGGGISTLAYFASLGAGYLLVEVALIQRLTLLLERPALSLAVVLSVLLVASGIGSLLSPRLPLRPTLAALVLCLILLAAVLQDAIRLALPWAWTGRALLTVLLLAPPGFLMGIPFASGLRRIGARSTTMIPWAWAINGATSGVAGVVAALVALDWGLTATLVLGALAYAGAFAAAAGLDSLQTVD